VKSALIEYLTEMLLPLGTLRSKSMFGGTGVYIDELFCAFVVDEILYIKADQVSVQVFIQAGCPAFVYTKDDQAHTMQYYQIPDQALDDAEALRAWVKLGMEAALRKSAGKSRSGAGSASDQRKNKRNAH
jgi:DNA transformation protein